MSSRHCCTSCRYAGIAFILRWMLRITVLIISILMVMEMPRFFMDISVTQWNTKYKEELDKLYRDHTIKTNKEAKRRSTMTNTTTHSGKLYEKRGELKFIHDYIYSTLDKLQNDGDCEQKKLVRCTNSAMSGFGSMVHRHVICAHIAFALGRAFFIDQKGYEKFNGLANFTKLESGKCSYLKKKMKNITDRCDFKDLHCYINKDGLEIDNRYKLLEFTREADFPAPKYIPGTLPNSMNERLKMLGVKNPWHWFTSQLLGYMILRPDGVFEQKYKNALAESPLHYPTIGVHIRGTDKVSETRSTSLQSYINQLYEIFDKKLNSTGMRYIYLATDDSRTLRKFRKGLNGSYVVQGNPLAGRLRLIGSREDRSYDVMKMILMDLYFMAKCDYNIVTYSSNIGRLLWELKTSLHPFIESETVKSMDVKNMFYGWYAYNVETYFLTIRDNPKEVVIDGYTIMVYKKGQLFHRTSRKGFTVILKGQVINCRYLRFFRSSNLFGNVFEQDVVPWPGNVDYKNDL